MAFIRVHRTYRFNAKGKDRVIDEMRTLIQDEGLFNKLHIVHQLSGVSTSTLENWFHGGTISPQNRTICAVTSALGYKRTWEKARDIELAKELKIAKAWNARQEKLRQEAERRVTRKKPNGHHHKEHRTS